MNDAPRPTWPFSDSLTILDSVLLSWAKRFDMRVETLDRAMPVRSIWISGDLGAAQICIDPDLTAEEITIHAARLDLNTREKWGRRIKLVVPLSKFEEGLEEIRLSVFDWIGKRPPSRDPAK